MANKIVPAGKPVQLRVRASGLDNGEPATFEVVRTSDGEQLATVQGKVVDGFATGEWTPDGPTADEELQEWDLAFTVKCAGLETKAAPLKVYTDWAELKCVDEEGQPLADVPVVIAVSDTLQPGDTDGGGVFKAEGLPYGAVEVEIDPPYELVEWVSQQPPQLEATVQKALPAKLVFPEAGQHKQYVNLDADDAHPEQGHVLKLEARLEDGEAGDKLYVKTVWAEANSDRNDPQPEVTGGVEEDWCPEGGTLLELEAADGTVTCEIELGLAGGDAVTIYVSGSKTFRKELTEVVTVTNWRRLYYQITRLTDGHVPDMGPAFAALADVFVEYELTQEVTVAPSDDLPVSALLDGREARQLGVSGTMLNVGEHDVSWWHDKFENSHAPREAHLILADSLYDCGPGGQPIEQTLEGLADYGRKTLHIADGETYTIFSKSLSDGESSVRPGSYWESTAPAGHPDHGKRGELTGADAEFGSLHGDRFLITLPPEAAAIVGEADEARRAPDPADPEVKHPVKVVVDVHVARGPFGGMTDGLHQVVTTSYDTDGFCGVLVHELGHAVKMCLGETPPGMSADDHGRQYTGRGHQGPHCAHGISEEEWGTGQDFRSGDGYCVMWGTSYAGSSTPLTFCSRCAPFTRAQGMTELEVD